MLLDLLLEFLSWLKELVEVNGDINPFFTVYKNMDYTEGNIEVLVKKLG